MIALSGVVHAQKFALYALPNAPMLWQHGNDLLNPYQYSEAPKITAMIQKMKAEGKPIGSPLPPIVEGKADGGERLVEEDQDPSNQDEFLEMEGLASNTLTQTPPFRTKLPQAPAIWQPHAQEHPEVLNPFHSAMVGKLQARRQQVASWYDGAKITPPPMPFGAAPVVATQAEAKAHIELAKQRAKENEQSPDLLNYTPNVKSGTTDQAAPEGSESSHQQQQQHQTFFLEEEVRERFRTSVFSAKTCNGCDFS